MMAIRVSPDIFRKKKPVNRIFIGSIFDKPQRFSEDLPKENAFTIDLSTDCKTERTILDFLTSLGLTMQMRGTEFIVCILTTAVNSLRLPNKTRDFYKIAADRYNLKIKIVEIAVIRAVASITLSKIARANRIFGSEVLEKDDLSAGSFLSAVCGRLVMLKCHEQGKTFFALSQNVQDVNV